MSADAARALMASLVLEDGRRWGEAAEPWQWTMVETMADPAAPPNRWESRPRGGSKTSDAAGLALAMLTTATLPPGSRSYTFAAGRDQARLVVDAADGFVRRTPELSAHVDLDNYRATARNGATLEVMSADLATSWGIRPAFVVLDEFAQWPDTNGPRLWESTSSALGKLPGARLLVITTSGDPAHFSHKVYEAAVSSPMWSVQDVPGPLRWASEDFLAEQAAILPESVFARLHLNRWASAEDRLTRLDDLRACVTLGGYQEPQPGRRYVIGLDIGLKHDRTAAAVCHRQADVVALDRMEVWAGTRANPVELRVVEEWLVEAARRYNGAELVIDPWQGIGMAQRLRSAGLRVREYAFTPSSVSRLAVTLHTQIRDHRLALPDDDALVGELAHVRLRETSPGVLRLDHDPDKHDDRAVALGLAVHALAERREPGNWGSVYVQTCAQCSTPYHVSLDACPACGEPRPRPELKGWGSIVYAKPEQTPMQKLLGASTGRGGWYGGAHGAAGGWYGGRS
jgi:phage terminase large subunit-like protein